MAAKSFHLFASLPTELQDLIWDHAVRPIPGERHVHSFLFDLPLLRRGSQYRVPGDFVIFDRGDGASVAVPHNDGVAGPDDSVYLTDSGLWIACLASQAAMKRRFNKNEWWSATSYELRQPSGMVSKGSFSAESDVAYTAVCGQRINGEFRNIRHITIRPKMDLMILKHPGMSNVDWFHLYAWNSIPLINIGSDRAPNYLGLNIGFDYEPFWLDVLKGRRLRRGVELTADTGSLVDMVDVFHEGTDQTLWFIDHRLRRRQATINSASHDKRDKPGNVVTVGQDSSEAKKERGIFYSARCRYTEVRQEDMPEWIVEDTVEDPGTAFEFFDLLADQHNGRVETRGSSRMKVLACELVPELNKETKDESTS